MAPGIMRRPYIFGKFVHPWLNVSNVSEEYSGQYERYRN
jgi:hypothetical protein